MSYMFDHLKRIMYDDENNKKNMSNKNTKHTLLSRTIQGILIMAVSTMLGELNIDFTEHEVTQFVLFVMQVGGMALAWYGRKETSGEGLDWNWKKLLNLK